MANLGVPPFGRGALLGGALLGTFLGVGYGALTGRPFLVEAGEGRASSQLRSDLKQNSIKFLRELEI